MEEENAARRRMEARRAASGIESDPNPTGRIDKRQPCHLLRGRDHHEAVAIPKPKPQAPMHLTDKLNIANEERLTTNFPGFYAEGIMRIKMANGQFFGEKSFDERMATAKKELTHEVQVKSGTGSYG